MSMTTRFSAKHVLVVEDDISQRRLVQAILGPLVHTEVVPTTDEALARLESEERYDLMVTDYRLPGRDGADLIAEVRQSPRHRSLPILVVTATDSAEDLERLKEVGANRVLLKPYEPMVLIALVLLGSAHALGAAA